VRRGWRCGLEVFLLDLGDFVAQWWQERASNLFFPNLVLCLSFNRRPLSSFVVVDVIRLNDTLRYGGVENRKRNYNFG
jgi:hypothetical protein